MEEHKHYCGTDVYTSLQQWLEPTLLQTKITN